MAVKIDMEITQTEADTVIVAFLSPSMSDVDAISAASSKIKDYVKVHRPRRLIFDFEVVRFFSSLLLGLLLEVRGEMSAYQGEVLISGINPQLHRVFKITNLDKIFRFFPERGEAVEAAKSN
jgi:anti-sigma B factor antagonist